MSNPEKSNNIMDQLKRIAFTLLLALAVFPLSAQQDKVVDSEAYLFRFIADKDMFFSPWSGNGKELERLLAAIEKNRAAIESGWMYLYVASHCTSGRTEQSDSVEKTRRNRVKSELITRGKVKEVHFVTDKKCPESYKTGDGEPRNVVIVLLPAGVEEVAELAGADAATRVEAYDREVSGEAERERLASEKRGRRNDWLENVPRRSASPKSGQLVKGGNRTAGSGAASPTASRSGGPPGRASHFRLVR